MVVRSQGYGQRGQAGANATNAQVAAAVTAYLQANPPAAGTPGKSAYEFAQAAGFTGTSAEWLASLKVKGDPGATLIGTVSLGQTATIAIALGIREVTAALTGTVKGGRYIAFCDSYRLNGGASIAGRPSGYAVVDCVCNTDGQITVSINAPLLAIGSSYALTCSVVRINT